MLFSTWLKEAHKSGLPEIRTFARDIHQDEAAVRTAIREPCSDGQVEGQVNRLKVLKRQMHGRANPDLLRRRVLGAARRRWRSPTASRNDLPAVHQLRAGSRSVQNCATKM